MIYDTLEDINPSVARRDSLGTDLEENSACQTLDKTNFSDDSDFDPIFDDPGPYDRVLRALAALEERDRQRKEEVATLEEKQAALEEKQAALERENEALREIVRRIEPAVWKMLTDDGWWGDVPEERRESETARALEGIEYRHERQRSLLVYGDVLKSIAEKAERGHDPGEATKRIIAVIFDRLYRERNRPIYIPNLPFGKLPSRKLTKMQRERLVGHLRRDYRFEVGKAPREAIFYGWLEKKYRKGLFVWLRENEPNWRNPITAVPH